MFLGSPQGRVGAFNKAEYAMAAEILLKHYTTSSNFKTALQFGKQCLTTSATSLELFHLYVEVVRPQINKGARDPLFVSLTGTPIRFGRHLTAFFKRVTGLNISSTRIRSIVTTESASLRGNNMITAEEQDGVHAQSGHCGVTAQKFYQMQDRVRDMANATAVHNKLLHSLPTNSNFGSPTTLNLSDNEPDELFLHVSRSCSPVQLNELDSDSDVSSVSDTSVAPSTQRSAATDASADDLNRSPFAQRSFVQRLPVAESSVGLLHPSIGESSERRDSATTDTSASKNRSPFAQRSFLQRLPVAESSVGLLHPSIADSSGRRIPWTDTEISIVGIWCTRYKSQHPGNINVVAGCLRYILNDNDVRQQFHPHHVLDSTRLRWGWQKYQELELEDSRT